MGENVCNGTLEERSSNLSAIWGPVLHPYDLEKVKNVCTKLGCGTLDYVNHSNASKNTHVTCSGE